MRGAEKERYLQTQRQAEAMGILDGVVFHRKVFDDQPAGYGPKPAIHV